MEWKAHLLNEDNKALAKANGGKKVDGKEKAAKKKPTIGLANEIDGNLFDIKWRRVVLDEGHVIKNPKAQMTMACNALVAESVLPLALPHSTLLALLITRLKHLQTSLGHYWNAHCQFFGRL